MGLFRVFTEHRAMWDMRCVRCELVQWLRHAPRASFTFTSIIRTSHLPAASSRQCASNDARAAGVWQMAGMYVG